MPTVNKMSKPIPSIGSRSTTLEMNDYSPGMNNYVSNDKFTARDNGSNLWRLSQDARITTLGEYETRKGFDIHSLAAGQTIDDTELAVTGAGNQPFSDTIRLAQPFVSTQSGRLSSVDVNLRNTLAATGTVIVEIWTDLTDTPKLKIAKTSIASNSITSTYNYLTANFANAPIITLGTAYWIVVYVQKTAVNSYHWSSTNAIAGAKTSVNSGTTWTNINVALNFKQYYATNAASKGLFRAYKSDGTKVTLLAHGTTLYSVNNVTGALTAIKTGLSASATHYQFKLINDIVYYVNGYDGYRKWNFTTESQVNATNYTLIEHHKGLVFLARKDEPTRVDYSNFGQYEVFTSTDFVYAIGPKTGDPVTALKSLNGYLVIFTFDNKIILSGNDNATFKDSEAPDQNGTYRQETLTSDANFMYYLSETGVYRSNGSEAQLMSENIYEAVRSMQNKKDACMVVSKGRLYLWYRSEGSAFNDSCYVWNLNYGSNGADSVESRDTDAFVCRAVDAFQDDDDLLVASSLLGQVYWQEKPSNDYTNLGGDINYLLQTHYNTYGTPSVLKQIRNLVPRFGAKDGKYTVECQYATDLRDNWATQVEIAVQGAGTLWGSGALWGSFTWGATAEVQSMTYIPGEYRRIAIRYKHFATRQPHKFLGHSQVVQTRRLR